MVTNEQEIKMVEDVVAGSQEAFTILYAEYQDYVRRVLRYVVAEDDLDDVVQETFIRIFRNLHTFKRDAALRTWIHRVALNAAFDALKQARGHAAVSLDETRENEHGEVALVTEPGYDDPAIQVNQDRALVRKAAGTLSEDDQAILTLLLEGYGETEIATLRGLNKTQAKSMLWRLRGRFKDAVEKVTTARKCKCGCGTIVTGPWAWVDGHFRKEEVAA